MKGFLFLSKLKNARTVHVFKAEVHFLYSRYYFCLRLFRRYLWSFIIRDCQNSKFKGVRTKPWDRRNLYSELSNGWSSDRRCLLGDFWRQKRKVIRTFRIHFSVFISEYCLWFFTLFSKRAFSLSIRRFKVYSRYWASRGAWSGNYTGFWKPAEEFESHRDLSSCRIRTDGRRCSSAYGRACRRMEYILYHWRSNGNSVAVTQDKCFRVGDI